MINLFNFTVLVHSSRSHMFKPVISNLFAQSIYFSFPKGQPYDANCAYSIKSSPTEVSMYLQNDDFRGLVVTVEGQTPSGTTDIMEVWLSLTSDFRVTNYIGPSTRLQKFQVGKIFIFVDSNRVCSVHKLINLHDDYICTTYLR